MSKPERLIESIPGLVDDLVAGKLFITELVEKYKDYNISSSKLYQYRSENIVTLGRVKKPFASDIFIQGIPGLLDDLDEGDLCVQELIEKYGEEHGLKYKVLWRYCDRHKIDRKKRKRFFNEDFFFEWTPELCYILGWLISDGYVGNDNRFELELKIDDIEILEHIKTHISMTKPIRKQTRTVLSKAKGKETEYRECYTARLCLFSKRVCAQLKEWGIVPNKTLITKWIEEIPEEFEHDFIRGVFDGDGSVFITKTKKLGFSICGTYELLEQIQDRLTKYTVNFGNLHPGHGNTWELSFRNVDDLERIYYYMYFNSNETTRLRRKYEKFMNWFDIDIDDTLEIEI